MYASSPTIRSTSISVTYGAIKNGKRKYELKWARWGGAVGSEDNTPICEEELNNFWRDGDVITQPISKSMKHSVNDTVDQTDNSTVKHVSSQSAHSVNMCIFSRMIEIAAAIIWYTVRICRPYNCYGIIFHWVITCWEDKTALIV